MAGGVDATAVSPARPNTPSSVTPSALPVPQGRKTRGPNKRKRWKYDGPVSTVPLNLDVSASTSMATRATKMFNAAYGLRRALQNDAVSRIDAYNAATVERTKDKTIQVTDKDGRVKERTVSGHQLVRERVAVLIYYFFMIF